MANKRILPKNVMDALIESGVEFDDDGNMIEDQQFIITDQDAEEAQGDDQIEDDENYDDTLDDPDTDNDEDNFDEELDNNQDEEVEDKKPKKKISKPSLTPREPPKSETPANDDISELKRNVKTLLERINSNSSNNNTNDASDDDEVNSVLAELRREAQDFRRLKAQTFADSVKKKVNDKNYGVDFNSIIASKEWDNYLSSKAYGREISDLYKQVIIEQDADAVVYFFDDFANKYLKSSNASHAEDAQDELDDLAVPDKTKATKSPKRRQRYDFEENDYIRKFDEAQRGRITKEEFIKFEEKFEKALSQGRVKAS